MDSQYFAGETSDWQETIIWKQLQQSESAEATSVKTMLNNCMPRIQKVLAQGQSSPSDFTLHDSGHAFRVARRMVEIIPADVFSKLSSYELALLLLSAYLHDIGMTPERRKVTVHYQYLLTGDPQDLSDQEINQFQRWLDDEGRGIVPPLSREPTSIETLRVAGEVITYYCRDRHNDWSDEWIRNHLSNCSLGTYVSWIDDLVSLCRSHHYGYHELAANRFEPKSVGTPARVVHLRYLACVLRIADVLEFDPERTPEVILRHRDISPASRIYWWKDHYISMVQKGNHLLLSARPPRAYIHRAIEVTADQIDEELRLCRTLADETHFEKFPGLPEDLPHRWDLLPSMHRDINPKEETYEYIDGAFRPDTNKLLELLSGVELYGNRLAAVRELLQNSFDAVREQIAYERLARSNPRDPELTEMLSKLHQVELRLETSNDGAWLICTDTGVGMTKSLITYHLLVSGTSRRHDILNLERRCKGAGFTLGRTGQFGIGVLSYFMLANMVMIKTRRSQEAGDAESSGWSFETEGVGSFGELRRDNRAQRGTEVRLRLRPGFIEGGPADWFREIRQYLEDTLFNIPCRFEFKSALAEGQSLVCQPGWVQQRDGLEKIVVAGLDISRVSGNDNEFLTTARLQEQETLKNLIEEVRRETTEHLQMIMQEGELPQSLGRYRIHLPYFRLLGGNSLAFLRPGKSGNNLSLDPISGCYAYKPDFDLRMGWKGMKVDLGVRDLILSQQIRSIAYRVIAEIDWNAVEAGKLSVNRRGLALSDKALEALSWLDQRITDMCRTFLRENRDSAYALLNYQTMRSELLPETPLNWLVIEKKGKESKAFWEPISFPAINRSDYARNHSIFLESEFYLWQGQSVYEIPRFKMLNRFETYGPRDATLTWNPISLPPDRIIIQPSKVGFRPTGLWTQKPTPRGNSHVVGHICTFPSIWTNLCGVQLEGFPMLWNPENPIIKSIDAAGWEWCQKSFKEGINPLPLKGDLLLHKSRAAAWVIRYLEMQTENLWEWLKDQHPSFLKELWALIFESHSEQNAKGPSHICHWNVARSYDMRLIILSPEGRQTLRAVFYDANNLFNEYIPDPGPEWRLELVNAKAIKKQTKSTAQPKGSRRAKNIL